jgi:hypothetical protein
MTSLRNVCPDCHRQMSWEILYGGEQYVCWWCADHEEDTADYGHADDLGVEPDVTVCRTCNHLAVEHTEGRYSVYGVCP